LAMHVERSPKRPTRSWAVACTTEGGTPRCRPNQLSLRRIASFHRFDRPFLPGRVHVKSITKFLSNINVSSCLFHVAFGVRQRSHSGSCPKRAIRKSTKLRTLTERCRLCG